MKYSAYSFGVLLDSGALQFDSKRQAWHENLFVIDSGIAPNQVVRNYYVFEYRGSEILAVHLFQR